MKRRLYIALIIFSFIWVIIGDLVSMHMRVISHIDLQQHSPFANIHKTVKKDGKQKTYKYFDEGFNFNTDFIQIKKTDLKPFSYSIKITSTIALCPYIEQYKKLLLGRAPPKLV